ncbi:hypothetical protein GPECTOR_522g509 [Gonium pectorale]|uniref:Uncharacterized protein n=1 Tax=Gonium pectorale TaxID=33097 RepID=A0A150FUQ7_GONPE|nr:hypothetical protein GPECTOR_522g509 [Gonium pectorale]|eukprot:KXZ41361.1 hypothetical protein GPECTOR_522g509 [Gonium pectorale]
MTLDRVWPHVYNVLQMLCGPGPASAVLDELVLSFKEGGATELLFLALLAAKDEAGSWEEALSMFNWLRQVARSELCRSPDLYRIMYEVLVVRGGVDGLAHAIALCREAHAQGVLHWFTRPAPLPSAATPPPGSPRSPSASAGSPSPSAAGPPGHVVLLEGISRVETVVTLLSWLAEVRDAAAAGIRLPGPWVDIVAPDASEAAGAAAGGGGGAMAGGLEGETVRPAVALVLEGRIGELLGVGPESGPEHRSLFPLHGRVRFYPTLEALRPGLVRVEAESLYEAMGLGTGLGGPMGHQQPAA